MANMYIRLLLAVNVFFFIWCAPDIITNLVSSIGFTLVSLLIAWNVAKAVQHRYIRSHIITTVQRAVFITGKLANIMLGTKQVP